MSDPYRIRRVSNYEGFRKIDVMQQKIAEGKLKPPREDVREYTCAICRRRVRSARLIPSRLIGESASSILPDCKAAFVGRFVLACGGPGGCAAKFGEAVA